MVSLLCYQIVLMFSHVRGIRGCPKDFGSFGDGPSQNSRLSNGETRSWTACLRSRARLLPGTEETPGQDKHRQAPYAVVPRPHLYSSFQRIMPKCTSTGHLLTRSSQTYTQTCARAKHVQSRYLAYPTTKPRNPLPDPAQ
ncbi:uncharacterized protein EV422DRAFT_164860 [Fimicolochytrium jonesii]|uniref:uncharacterized protein n=1 Tax=Fimicolochytrium jonesii TaxID=1396493 RepID=UPI0022FED10B|nr:uncharacterized protein EV422DRAFT_164860 [Fimicolochytrium jonesii]KAI8818780.1 hypothetical protein EV422DRAFT_164860 [Fimicolochytrium jonesii]